MDLLEFMMEIESYHAIPKNSQAIHNRIRHLRSLKNGIT